MKNLKIIWPTIIAITISLSLRSCHNQHMQESMKKVDFGKNIPNISEQIKDIDDLKLPKMVIVRDGNTYVQKVEEESVKTR